MKFSSLPKVVAGLFFVTLVFVQCTSESDKIHKQLATEIEALNKQCPLTISPTIRIDSCVLLKNNDMQYYYTYTDTMAFDTLQFEDEIVARTKEMTKIDPGMADIRGYGVSLEYIYRDLNGKNLYTFKITPEDYK